MLYANDEPRVTQGRTLMYVDDTLVLNIGQAVYELQVATSENTGLVVHYFEASD
jgi:hypothetical protein